jgi:hypothetical protein
MPPSARNMQGRVCSRIGQASDAGCGYAAGRGYRPVSAGSWVGRWLPASR